MTTKVTPVDGHTHDKQAARQTAELLRRELDEAIQKYGKKSEEVAILMHSQSRIYRELVYGYHKR